MLDGVLLQLLTAAKYLNSKIAVNGRDFPATQNDLDVIGLSYTLPASLDELLGYVVDKIKEVYAEIKRMVGKAHWDAIIEAYDNTLTDYMSKKFDKPLKPR